MYDFIIILRQEEIGYRIMIVVRFVGGLGNQLFQYSLLLAMKERYPSVEVLADISAYYVLDLHYGFEINKIFSLEEKGVIKIATNRQLYTVRREIPYFIGGNIGKILQVPIDWINARIRPISEKKGLRHIIREEASIWNNDYIHLKSVIDHLDVTKNWYLDGYWQQEIYYWHILEEIKKICVFPNLIEGQDIELKKKIMHSNSVSIHVRRGDYVHSKYDILGIDYYIQAVEYIKRRVEKPVFFVFSEDVQYIETNFSWLKNKVLVSFNKGEDSYKDMQLMSLCKHNIIANSSFSTWAAYLNGNKNKIVIYPSMYTKNEVNGEKMGWTRINNAIFLH